METMFEEFVNLDLMARTLCKVAKQQTENLSPVFFANISKTFTYKFVPFYVLTHEYYIISYNVTISFPNTAIMTLVNSGIF